MLKRLGAVVAAGALVASGLTVASSALTASPASAETNKPGANGLQENRFYAYVRAGETLTVDGPFTVTDPAGATSGPGTFGPAEADGVWIIEKGSGDPAQYTWEITAHASDGADLSGRVWSEMYSMIQPGDDGLRDYQWWVLNDSGYQYQITTNGYNGVLSRIRANAVGFADPDTCEPTYKSVEAPNGQWNPVPDCYGDYRVFFEEPAGDLPATAPSAEGVLTIAPEPLLEEDLEATEISFAPTADGSAAGTLSYAIDPRFSGGYTVQIDADGNGSYDDPLDRTETFGTDGSASYSYDFDGLDANGDPIGVCTPATARVAFDRIGEVHVLQDDVEDRTGGIEIIRQTGPAAPDATIYWDDTALQKPTPGTTPVLDGTAGFDSTGGVHGWDRASGWGGSDRGIDDWTYYATEATSPTVGLRAATNDCLAVEKTSDFTPDARVGDTVTFHVTATNTGGIDFTAENPAVVFDDLGAVLDDADYNGDAAADVDGEISFAEPLLSWSGALGAGETVELTYSVTLTGAGDRQVTNVAWSPEHPEDPAPEPPVCDPRDESGRDPVTGEPCGRTDGALPALRVDKSADATELPRVGETVTYTVTATNIGPGAYSDEAPAVVVDDLTAVLDDAAFVAGSLTTSTGDDAVLDGARIRWEGALGAGDTVTITYQVTYTAAGDALLTNVAWQPRDPGDPTPETPECNPRTADGIDPATGEPCGIVAIPGGQYTVAKDVDPADGSTVVAGQELTYTITFDSTGTAPAVVDTWVDDLTGVLDDAELVSAPAASSEALTVGGIEDGRFTVDGTIPQGETVTVTYTVRVLPDGGRGDNVLGNVVFEDGTTPSPDCAVDDPLCTENPVPEIVDSKSVDPESGASVAPGDELTYTLTFENLGAAAGTVDRVDDLTHVLDDADVTAAPVASDDALAVSEIADGRFSVSGTLQPGQKATVTYTVTVRPVDRLGDARLANFLLDPGTPPPPTPDECEEGDEDCTENPVAAIVDSKSVDPESGSTVRPGQDLTYTLTFENRGAAAGEVDRVDDLTHVLDDADVTTAPVSSDPALEVSEVADGRFSISGTLAGGQKAAVTYTVTIRAAADVGDGVAANFLLDPGTPPPPTPEECEEGDEDCTENPVAAIVDSKSVDPESGASVVPGRELTYTLTFENLGAAAGEVDRVDDLTHVLDDADVTTAPVSSDPALEVSGIADGRFSITGELAGGQKASVSYTVVVKDEAALGDSELANFLLDPDAPTPPEPVCEDGEDCTYNPVSNVAVSKSADPASGTSVDSGQDVTYTLTFRNTGAADAAIDYTDHMVDVLDDAEISAAPEADRTGVVVSDIRDGRFSVSGEVAAGDTVTVTYGVTVLAWADQGDHVLGNVVTVTGQEPPAECADDSRLCTEHPTEEPPAPAVPPVDPPAPADPPAHPPLAATGSDIGSSVLLAALALVLVGGGIVFLSRRRRSDIG